MNYNYGNSSKEKFNYKNQVIMTPIVKRHVEPVEIPISEQREDFNEIFLDKMQYPKDEKLFRPYQMNIVKTCLQTNTLVCLPTGLGKTFIASVIIYNFHLWFSGKIFFFAPTKPLVNQQKDAFLKMFRDLEGVVTEVNGAVSKKKRETLYNNYKIFFMTPQTLDNDLSKKLIDCKKVSLLIFDEAHKAQKKFAYTNIVTKICQESPNNNLRTVALSASPGSNNDAIQNVIDSLKIKNIELRTEKDPDLQPFLFNKEIKIIEVETTKDIIKIKNFIEKLLSKRIDILKKFKIVPENVNVKYLGKKQILDFQENLKNRKNDFENEIGNMMVREMFQNFSIVMRLLNSKSLLVEQGIESFKESIKKFFEEDKPQSKFKNSAQKNFATPNKFNMNKEIPAALKNLIESEEFKEIVKEIFEPNEMTIQMTNQLNMKQGCLTSVRKFDNRQNNNIIAQDIFRDPKHLCIDKSQHPKLIKLTEIIENNHQKIRDNSRVIIFTQFKDSAREVLQHLQNSGKFCDIPFSIFTGQDKNFKQKDQLEVMKKFRDGEIKVLIATSVAEEGLDIGEVDLIICYDMASTSPIKMIQRFGRTGRKRNGSVIVLASKGEEKSKYYMALHRLTAINKELNKLKYDVDMCKIKFFQSNVNVLIIPKRIVENVEFFDLENEVIENTEDIISECEEDLEEDEDEFINDNDEDEFETNFGNVIQNVYQSKSKPLLNFTISKKNKEFNFNTEIKEPVVNRINNIPFINENDNFMKFKNYQTINSEIKPNQPIKNTKEIIDIREIIEIKKIKDNNNNKDVINSTDIKDINQFSNSNFKTEIKQSNKIAYNFKNVNSTSKFNNDSQIKEIKNNPLNAGINNKNNDINDVNKNDKNFYSTTKTNSKFKFVSENNLLQTSNILETPLNNKFKNNIDNNINENEGITSKPLKFTILNKKTNSNNKFLTNKIEDKNKSILDLNIPVINLDYEENFLKGSDSPVDLDNYILDEIFNDCKTAEQNYNNKNNIECISLLLDEKVENINKKIKINECINLNQIDQQEINEINNINEPKITDENNRDTNDFIFDLIQKDSFFLRELGIINPEENYLKSNAEIKFSKDKIEMKENIILLEKYDRIEKVESTPIPQNRQLFREIENENLIENINKNKLSIEKYFDSEKDKNYKRKFSSISFTPHRLDGHYEIKKKFKLNTDEI